MNVHVLIINDRHTDIEVTVFVSSAEAIEAAERETDERGWVTTGENARLDELPEGWLFASNHPTESDTLQVVTTELQGGPQASHGE